MIYEFPVVRSTLGDTDKTSLRQHRDVYSIIVIFITFFKLFTSRELNRKTIFTLHDQIGMLVLVYTTWCPKIIITLLQIKYFHDAVLLTDLHSDPFQPYTTIYYRFNHRYSKDCCLVMENPLHPLTTLISLNPSESVILPVTLVLSCSDYLLRTCCSEIGNLALVSFPNKICSI